MGSEEETLEILADIGDALEALGVQIKQRIRKKVEVGWDPNKVKWEQAEGASGLYERSEDVNNKEFKEMVKDLAGHGGRLTREGYFYWLFENGATVGRKRRGKREAKRAEADIETVKSKFPSDLAGLLVFEATGDYYVMKPKEYLGAENFSKIASIVRGEGGEYISAGKGSHFRIPRK